MSEIYIKGLYGPYDQVGFISHGRHIAFKFTLLSIANLIKFISVSQITESVDIWEHADDLLQASLFYWYKKKNTLQEKRNDSQFKKDNDCRQQRGSLGLVVGLWIYGKR